MLSYCLKCKKKKKKNRGGSRISFRVLQILQKKIYYNKMCQIKEVLLQIILTEVALKRGYHGTCISSQTK